MLLTLSCSVDDLNETHFIIYYQLFSICIFYRRIISLTIRIIRKAAGQIKMYD